jgi:hypothetical protein
MLEDAEDEDRRVIAEEASLSQTTPKGIQVTLSRKSSILIGKEAERRIERGIHPSIQSLTGEAIQLAFSRGREPRSNGALSRGKD